jgi:sugar lactone lactonase YvrE
MMRRFGVAIATAALIAMMVPFTVLAETSSPEQTDDTCQSFEQTGFQLCGEFLTFWNDNGGLPVFGYPLTDAHDEVNPDTGETYSVQYFERQRFELHPENAGTVYNVLFGRIGAQILDMQGRDWMTFPKADPSAEHYMAETGHAIAPEFYDYWASHGLDYGDPGVSFRESLLLFGYPISEPATETNADGDTVLTQWFERAVFEYHPENDDANKVLLRRVGAELLDAMTPPEADFDVVAEGLNNPRHLNLGPDGSLYVAEAGTGGDQCVDGPPDEDGNASQVCYGTTGSIHDVLNDTEAVEGLPSTAGPDGAFASGPHDVSVAPDGTMYIVIGEDAGPEDAPVTGFWNLVKVNEDGTTTVVADLNAYEHEANPDQLEDAPADQGGEPGVHSNPYAIYATNDGVYVVDAGGNDILWVTPDGEVSTFAVFSIQMVDAPDFLGLPEGTQIPMQPVPTSITVGPDGAVYAGQLTGFPFPVGGANIYRMKDANDDGDALDEGEMTVYASGLTAIMDVEFGPDNNLYAVEIAQDGLMALEGGDPTNPPPGVVLKIAADGTQTEIAKAGLVAPTGIEITDDGTIYISNFGIFAGMGQVVKLHATVEPAPAPAFDVIASGLNNPRGIAVTDDGTVYVAESGTGGDTCVTQGEGEDAVQLCFGETGAITMIADGEQSQVATGLPSLSTGEDATGPQDVAVDDDGDIYAIIGLGADPAERAAVAGEIGDLATDFGTLVSIDANGDATRVADVSVYESDANPDQGEIDSNPFSLVQSDDGWSVADAGGNALGQFDVNGTTTISTVAVFPTQMQAGPGGQQIPAQAVPTGVVTGPDGAYYVGELTGFPFAAGSARVWRVMPGEEPTVYASGFTNILDVAFDSDGNLYVLEMAKNGLTSGDPAGAIIRVAADGTQTEVASDGLVMPTGMAIGPDGSIYVSNMGVMPGQGQVIRINP